jgi:hypothetical protein
LAEIDRWAQENRVSRSEMLRRIIDAGVGALPKRRRRQGD